MKQVVFALILFLLFFTACMEEAVKEEEVQLIDLKEHHMKIIPENPGSSDTVKLIVYDDCSYNVLSGVIRNGQKIDIQKQFNSMMKWPCFQTNDTISIGQLPEGSYTVNYQLLDVSTQVSNHIALAFSFKLLVGR